MEKKKKTNKNRMYFQKDNFNFLKLVYNLVYDVIFILFVYYYFKNPNYGSL